MTAAEVKAALKRHHQRGQNFEASAWVCIEEAFSGWASLGGGIDLLAVGAWKSASTPGLTGAGRYRGGNGVDTRNPLVAYEVKVTRADFRRELYGYVPGPKTKWRTRGTLPWPYKAQHAIDRTHYFIFATPAGLLHPDEIARRTPWTEYDRPRKGALYLPEGVGLVECSETGVRVKRKAPATKAQEWTRHEIAELLRRAHYTALRSGTK